MGYMWFKKHQIEGKTEGFTDEIPSDFFTKPLTEKEVELYNKSNCDNKKKEELIIPQYLKLPTEYIELLAYSNGGNIINGEQEFSFFDIHTIREFYIVHGFVNFAPNMLPIAFNTSGIFYMYNFLEDKENPPIYGVHASSIGFDDSTGFLGNSLEEVMKGTRDIYDVIDDYLIKTGRIKIKEQTPEEKKLIELYTKQKQLKEDKNSDKIGLKEFLLKKRKIEKEIKELEIKIKK